MPADAIAQDPMAHRYFDYPRPGSIYRLPDIPSLVRGPTYVKLPSGRDIEVPAQLKTSAAVPGQVHDNNKAGSSMDDLIKLLSGKRRDAAPAGFKTGGVFDVNTQNPLLHPREAPRQATVNGQGVQF